MILPRQRRGGRRLGRAEVDRVVHGSATALEISREGPQGIGARGGGLAHADAAEAARLVHPRPGVDEGLQAPSLEDVLEGLAAAGIDLEAELAAAELPFHYLGGDHEVAVVAVAGGADDDLVHDDVAEVPRGLHVVGILGQATMGSMARKSTFGLLVVLGSAPC